MVLIICSKITKVSASIAKLRCSQCDLGSLSVRSSRSSSSCLEANDYAIILASDSASSRLSGSTDLLPAQALAMGLCILGLCAGSD